jgi:hypothetical protein
MRAMGYILSRMKGAEQHVSQVRTWHKRRHGAEFGIKGTGTEAGGAVKAIRSCQECLPPKDVTADEGRSPVALPILKALTVDAMARGDVDVAVAEALAFNGLCRMGELTATDRRFDWKKDLTETDIEFEPSHEHATKGEPQSWVDLLINLDLFLESRVAVGAM